MKLSSTPAANRSGQGAVTKGGEGNDEKAPKFAEASPAIARQPGLETVETALMLPDKLAVLIGARDVCREILLKQLRPDRFAEHIELALR